MVAIEIRVSLADIESAIVRTYKAGGGGKNFARSSAAISLAKA